MYSPTQQEFNLEPTDHFSQASLGTPHTTVGAVPVGRSNRVFNPSQSYQLHQRQNSFGAASIAISPPNAATAGRGIPFTDPNNSAWFGTSLDSTSSSFGQSPIFGGRDVIVSPSTSASHLDGFTGTEDDEMQQRNLQEIFEKRRRRRESHNAVERRRRDNINERIQELSTLLPEHLLETAPTTSNVMAVAGAQNGANGKAINKGTILKLSVDHIKELREEVVRYKEKIQELERMVEAAKRGEFIDDSHLDQKYAQQPRLSKADPFFTQPQSLSSHPPPPLHSSSQSQHPHQQQQSQQQPSAVHLMDTTPRPRHERMGSLQFQQQFVNMHIGGGPDDTRQA
ncbi:helix-loop-helix DNA-binding domain-containing protein [Radiomyces spectabilis]|uniref:helix-loop-helix DNA-binding domain-containing protein n=1 Tax=Radiomyces spectabilis TaxID=64574 RepID=UPI00221E43FA|nr:helix-loop-helix DNA-binding domain-containing protein [Radiomyces spectabilis]KAI8391370.1 helix-loop-helix DNA-binding domain-containing protein [Radiomyces spectabilis]